MRAERKVEAKGEGKETEQRPFFDCKRDEDITCKEDIIRAQESTTSKCMSYIRQHMGKWAHKIFFTKRPDSGEKGG